MTLQQHSNTQLDCVVCAEVRKVNSEYSTRVLT